MRRNSRPHAGYVLVLTLGVIALAAITLAGLARYSLQLATRAQDATQELQHRWGLFSTRYMLLDRAAEILEAQVDDEDAGIPPWPKPNQLSATYLLGTHEFRVRIADEDSKVNLNTIYVRKRDKLLPAIHQLGREAGMMRVRLLPQADVRKPFTSWGQVFDLSVLPPSERSTGEQLGEAAQQMTCWGSGQLNIRRASDAALRQVAELALPAGHVSELVDLRKHWGGQQVNELLAELELRRPQLLAVSRLLSTESRSYSLSVDVRRGARNDSYLYVCDGKTVCFAW